MGKMTNFEISDSISMGELEPTTWSAMVPLFDLHASKKLLIFCEKRGIGVLGIEGFVLKGRHRYPRMDYIADFSKILEQSDFKKISIQAAFRFLESANESPELLFEYVLVT